MKEAIEYLIRHYEGMVNTLNNQIAAEENETDRLMLISRKNAYELDIIPDLKKILKSENKQATIWMKFKEGEYPYGTYDCNTAGEIARINEIAIKIKEERGCEVEVREA